MKFDFLVLPYIEKEHTCPKMEEVDRFYTDAAVGDEVYVEVNFPADDPLFEETGESEVVVRMFISHIEPYYTNNGSYVVEMVDDYMDNQEVYRIQIHPGEYFQICIGETRRTVNGVRFDKKPSEVHRPRLSKNLVRLAKATKSMISAKYEAYMDPQVAAMAETPALVTRNRAYQRLEIK